ncbi:putative aminoacyl-tRNA editing enzyme YbaK, ProX [Candidatus Burkholderia pumila]|uniref:Aminoacyl-tRNA editing enzyme YbaK, ProX n=1 Tax=Candidatus Burkholderia pumila TaxID=1090375 RepID=A0ABR5HK72_9BURK|nr:putative aminoacyl-tRNA editing enzyme YbaK, ProX [Candidatus Burkholderia pumila]
MNMAKSGELTFTGARCKNLLLQDKQSRYFLIVTAAAKSLDLSALAATLGSKRLSFASTDKLFELFGIRPGSFSPLALVNDDDKRMRLVIVIEFADEPVFLFHPLDNGAMVLLMRAGLDAFLFSPALATNRSDCRSHRAYNNQQPRTLI